jgi:O-antigen ligase
MGSLTRLVLAAYAFTLSWDNISLPVIGSMSRAAGLAVTGLGIATIVMRGRLRRPDPVLLFATAFSAWSVLSLLWTVSFPDSASRAFTYGQVVVSAWLIREFVRSTAQIEPLMTAYCVGAFVPLTSLLSNFLAGVSVKDSGRFTGTDLNPNMLGLYLVIGLPMAWHLIMRSRGVARHIGIVYCALAPMGVLLTATRGGFVAAIVASAIIPLTLPRSVKAYSYASLVLVVAIVLAIVAVPPGNWDRILSIPTEIAGGGTLSGRTDIWKAGLQFFPEHPVLGFGAGTFPGLVGPHLRFGRPIVSHNTAIGLLIEEGLIGLSLFTAVVGACAWRIIRLRPPYRALFAVLMATWLVGAMDGNWEHVKTTWLLFGLISAQSGLECAVARSLTMEETGSDGRFTPDFSGVATL